MPISQPIHVDTLPIGNVVPREKVFLNLTLSWGVQFCTTLCILPCRSGKIRKTFYAGYGLTFSFYLFYPLSKNLMTVGAILQKILYFEGVRFSSISYIKAGYRKTAIISCRMMQLTSNLQASKVLM